MRLVGFRSKAAEVVLTGNNPRRRMKQLDVERTAKRPFIPGAKRRRGFVIETDVVAVSPGERGFARVKPGMHRVNGSDPTIARQESIQGAVQCGPAPVGWSAEAHTLTDGVHAGIGTACSVCHGTAGEQTLKNPLEFTLNRATGGLALPTDKAGAIVLEGSEEGPAHLARNLASGDGLGQATQILVTIDKSLLVRVQFFPPDTH
jgi:hypothetical protein